MNQSHLFQWVVWGKMKNPAEWKPPTLSLGQSRGLLGAGFLPLSVSLTVLDEKMGW